MYGLLIYLFHLQIDKIRNSCAAVILLFLLSNTFLFSLFTRDVLEMKNLITRWDEEFRQNYSKKIIICSKT